MPNPERPADDNAEMKPPVVKTGPGTSWDEVTSDFAEDAGGDVQDDGPAAGG